MMIADPKRSNLYQNFKSNLKGTVGGNANGNRHYWISDFNAHRRSGYMVGLKIASNRTKVPETVNGENLLGKYQGVGSMTLLVDGDEYYNIFPVWDWGLYPGTTTRHRTPDSINGPGTTAFAGGASDGTYGAVAYDMSWDGVTGKKAWFFFDDEFVALGNSIESTAEEEICTTLNQCHRDGNASVEYGFESGSTLSEGTHVLSNPKWVYHDKVGYVFPQANPVTVKLADQSGSWNLISSTLPTDSITKPVFSLYLNHGIKPTGASYQYIVMPDSTPAKIQAFAASNQVRVVTNTSAVQAVYHNGLSRGGIVFYEAGSVVLRPGFTVTADAPCILLVDAAVSNNVILTACNPKNEALVVAVDTVIDGNADQTVLVLPDGEFAGSSVTRPLGFDPGTPPSGAVVPSPATEFVLREPAPQ
jgi:chondroitin AC lyase